MGKCFSYLLYCCGKQDNASQFGESSDRTQLIDSTGDSTGIQRQSENYYCPYVDPAYARKTEEHSDLNKILDEMAANVIDVGTLGSHSLEQHESRERSSFYFSKMRSLNNSKSLSKLPKQQCLLLDLPNPDKMLSSSCAISNSELQNMCHILNQIDNLIDDMKIGNHDDLIIPFQVQT